MSLFKKKKKESKKTCGQCAFENPSGNMYCARCGKYIGPVGNPAKSKKKKLGFIGNVLLLGLVIGGLWVAFNFGKVKSKVQDFNITTQSISAITKTNKTEIFKSKNDTLINGGIVLLADPTEYSIGLAGNVRIRIYDRCRKNSASNLNR
jgi:hypothetical protein